MSSESILAFTFGVVFISALLIIAVYILVKEIDDINPVVIYIFRVVLALSGAGVGAIIPGFFEIDANLMRVVVRAGGALGVFAFIYLLNPPELVKDRRIRLRAAKIKAPSEEIEKDKLSPGDE